MGFSETPVQKQQEIGEKKPKNLFILFYSAAYVELDLQTQVTNSYKHYQFCSNSLKGIQYKWTLNSFFQTRTESKTAYLERLFQISHLSEIYRTKPNFNFNQ